MVNFSNPATFHVSGLSQAVVLAVPSWGLRSVALTCRFASLSVSYFMCLRFFLVSPPPKRGQSGVHQSRFENRPFHVEVGLAEAATAGSGSQAVWVGMGWLGGGACSFQLCFLFHSKRKGLSSCLK